MGQCVACDGSGVCGECYGSGKRYDGQPCNYCTGTRSVGRVEEAAKGRARVLTRKSFAKGGRARRA
jgi:hypothetical protein